MAYKSVLVVATDPASANVTIPAAAALAAREDGHLDILALGVDATQVGYSYIGAGAVMLEVGTERAEADARANEAAVRAAIKAQPVGLRWGVESAICQIGGLGEIVAQSARFADIVVLARPYAKDRGVEAEAVVEAALFDGGVPVLVVPDAAQAAAAPRRIVIAWNQSREAMAAVRGALPFLKAADRVDIAVIDPPTHGPERSDPGGALCQMLVRHGVKAEVSVLARTLPTVAEVLARHLRDQNADLLVMGAYGHSRFRESILGGATRDMLENASLPVLMAH